MLNHCRTEYGSLLCQSGRWREAESTLRQAADDAVLLQRHQQILARCALADLRIGQGRLGEAAQLLAGLDEWDEARTPLARLQLARGEYDLCAATCRLALLRFAGDRLRGSVLLGLLVAAELGRGDRAAAAGAVTELAEAAAATGQRPVRVRAALAAGRSALAGGDRDAAVTSFENALDALGPEGWDPLRGEVHLALAGALADTDPALARGHAHAALALFRPLGAPERHAARRLLERLGAPVPSADPLAGLTAREREILGLLAQGLSNPQIAARLVISAKTAEHHVGAILRKLQVRSRSEAAVLAATLDG
jgi:DNA-binding CsgD family transcriptional regulator/Tfp pilus assembly protein PilF